jgi:hypothetical protein
MVAIDGPHNGWRCLVLALAQADDLVMNAVLAVSSFHLSQTTSYRKGDVGLMKSNSSSWAEKQLPYPCPNQLYTTAIDGLQRRRDLRSYDRAVQQTVLLAILVLLVGVMVTGSPDFPTMFRALEFGLDAINGEVEMGSGDMADFLKRQIHK